jgi:SIR2-like domain
VSNTTKKRLTIILGAGASYGCGDGALAAQVNSLLRPPLVQDLFGPQFDALLARYPGLTARLDELRNDLRNNANFEEVFRGLLESAERHRKFWPLQIPMYLRELFWTISVEYVQGSSKYDTLIRQALESSYEEVLFINLNYDLFLENALTTYDQHEFSDIGSYWPRCGRWRYIKPHGSVNWARILENCPEDSCGWFLPARLREMPVLSPELRVVMWNRHSGDFYIPGGGPRGYLYPQLIVPTDKPKAYVCPLEYADQARNFVQDCESFLVIGFSGRDQDLLDLLHNARRDARWFIVGSGDAGAIFARFTSGGAAGNTSRMEWTLYDRGFARFVDDGSLGQLLSRS